MWDHGPRHHGATKSTSSNNTLRQYQRSHRQHAHREMRSRYRQSRPPDATQTESVSGMAERVHRQMGG
eukprot:1609957-Rhodomonas_salina.2